MTHDGDSEILVDHLPAARRSLRVAVVTETYPPEVNGVALTMARVVEGLHRRNHALQLIRPRQALCDADGGDAPRFDEVLLRGLPIPRYPHLRMGVPSKRQLLQLWAHHRPDVVHIATEGPLGWSALQAALHLHLPVSTDFRTNFHAYSRHYGVGWLHKPIMAYLRKFHNRAQSTMVPTEALRRDLEARGFRDLAVVARGVDAQQFHPERRSAVLRGLWGLGQDDLAVLCVGRLAPEKNLGTAVRAFEAIQRRNPRARLVLVGEGPSWAELRAACPQAWFAGVQTGMDLAEHYASADLFLFPSMTETYGNVTGEAMASGLPVVAFDYAAAAQLIRNGESGRLIDLGDEAAFVQAAGQLAASPDARRLMGVRARSSAVAMDWDSVVRRVEDVLMSVLARAPSPPARTRVLDRQLASMDPGG